MPAIEGKLAEYIKTCDGEPTGPSDAEKAMMRLRDDYGLYSKANLKINDKSGALIPFTMNIAQRYIHRLLEEQRQEKGYVRAIILKCRQMGSSTYLCGRNYHGCTFARGKNAVVMAHDLETAQSLFEKVRQFNEASQIKVDANKATARELRFEQLNSSIAVMTAGSKETGRGRTIHRLHASEAAFWPNADMHIDGLMQAVPSGSNKRDTEVIFESTANGVGGRFYDLWMKAQAGMNDYLPIFIPWYWMDDYVAEVPRDFVLSHDEQQYKDIYKLTDEQMVWRRGKLIEFHNDEARFAQEYPANAAEAFKSSGDGFIPAAAILEARKETKELANDSLPVIGGLDIARSTGGDQTVLAIRKGRRILAVQVWPNEDDTMPIVGRVAAAINYWRISKLFMDAGNIGIAVYDYVKDMNGGAFANHVEAIHFAGKSYDPDRFENKRAEMAENLRQWIMDQPCRIPDDDLVQSDIASIEKKYANTTKLQIIAKQDIKKKLGRSPDFGDAIMLTFADHVEPVDQLPFAGTQISNTLLDELNKGGGGIHGY